MSFSDPETAATILLPLSYGLQGNRRCFWARLLAYVTGRVNQELLLRNEYLAAENRTHSKQWPVGDARIIKFKTGNEIRLESHGKVLRETSNPGESIESRIKA
jgi:hypothetical protein